MGLQIRTYVNGEQKYIDLYGDEEIKIDVSFAEIQDITKRNSAYTQEFKVPGTNNNNEIFNYFFEINAVPLDWNPKKKFEASLIYNGYEIFNGNIRLNQVSIIIKEKIYSITFYAQVGDLASNIGDKAMCNIDTSSLNHSLYNYFTAQTLLQDPSLHPVSLIPSGSTYWSSFINPISKGDVQYILGQRGYDYTGSTYGTIRDINTYQTPILDFSGITGYFDNVRTPVIPPYLIPSIRTRKLYELIVNQADYSIESDFFQTDYFGRYYVPLSFNTESTYMAQSKSYDFLIENNSGTTNANGGSLKTVDDFSGSSATLFVFKAKDLIYDNLGFNPINLDNYPNDGTAFSSTGPYGLSAVTDYVFAIPQSYTDDQQITIEYTWTWSGTPDPYGTGILGGRVAVRNLYQASSTGSDISGVIVFSQDINIDDTFSPQTSTGTFTTSLCNIFTFNQTSFYFVTFDALIPDLEITNLKISMAVKQQCLPFTIELYKEMDCTKKQIEFIQDVNKMFNLVVIPHPIKPKTLIVEPLIDWIGKGELLDWTDKVNYNDAQILRPTTSIINGSIFASNKIDKDFVNNQFNTKSNKIYGQNIFDLGVDYKNEYIPLTQQLGQNTDYYLNASGSTNIALPCYFILKQGNTNGQPTFEYRPFRSLPRMAFKSVPLPSGNTGQPGYFTRVYDQTYSPCATYPSGNNYNPVNAYQSVDMQNVNRLTTYPFAISNFSHYTVYDSTLKFTDDELVYPEVDNQYDRYYRDYIEDLISEENKIYNIRMYLTPWEVSQLYFNEIIFIKNTKFRINKITNLNLIDPDLCDVELIKLTRDYTPTPVRFYDFIDCSDGCNVIHSHTDLNYLLWAFARPLLQTEGNPNGKFVELVTSWGNGASQLRTVKRFKVVEVEYNPDYVYQNVYFNDQVRNILSGGYLQKQVYDDFVMYDSCGGTNQSFTFDIINNWGELENSCYCVNMVCTNNANIAEGFSFIDCSGNTQTILVGPNTSTSVCGCYNSFSGSTFSFCPNLNPLIPC